jgi:hypothetical protein
MRDFINDRICMKLELGIHQLLQVAFVILQARVDLGPGASDREVHKSVLVVFLAQRRARSSHAKVLSVACECPDSLDMDPWKRLATLRSSIVSSSCVSAWASQMMGGFDASVTQALIGWP